MFGKSLYHEKYYYFIGNIYPPYCSGWIYILTPGTAGRSVFFKYLHFTLKQIASDVFPPPPPRVIYIREVQNLFNVLLVELGGKNYF